MSDIFISYSNQDRPRVRPLVEALEARGWSVFWDTTLLPGETWRKKITTELGSARCVIVLWSQTSIGSDWVEQEAEEGQSRRILVPALLDLVTIPLGFRNLHDANLVGWNGVATHPEFQKMLLAIEPLLKTERHSRLATNATAANISDSALTRPEANIDSSDSRHGRKAIFVPTSTGQSISAAKPQPSHLTSLFCEAFNLGRWADGGAFEISANFNLGHGLPLAQTGWSPNQVRLFVADNPGHTWGCLDDSDIITAFEKSEMNRQMRGQLRILDPASRNGRKFAITKVSPNVDEREDLTITLRETDYATIMRALPGILAYPEKRRLYGNADPSLNQVPNAMGVHFICIFEDGQVLAIHRSGELDYDPYTWSFSGEEQFKDSDYLPDEHRRTERFLLRAVAEEVFPLGGTLDDEDLQKRCEYLMPLIRSIRIWSVFVQEPSLSFVLFGVFEIGLTAKRYRQKVRELCEFGFQMSGEGSYHTVEIGAARRLLQGHAITATQVFGNGNEQLLTLQSLHPTSRYRLGRLLDVLRRNGTMT